MTNYSKADRVINWLEKNDYYFQMCKTSEYDNFDTDEIMLISEWQGMTSNQYDWIESILKNEGIGLDFNDTYYIDPDDDNTCYYTEHYNKPTGCIIGDGYIIGEDSGYLDSLDASDIVSTLIYQMDGNIYRDLTPNIFKALAGYEDTHYLDMTMYCTNWNKYDYSDLLEKMAERNPNWYFITNVNGFEMITIRKDKR